MTNQDQEPYDEYDPPLEAYELPKGAGAVCLLTEQPCGLCDEPCTAGPGGAVQWWDGCSATYSHAACWLAEEADASDPYRYYGVSRRDF